MRAPGWVLSIGVLLAAGSCGGSGFAPPTAGSPPPSESVTVAIDAGADRHPISPDVYGATLWYEHNWVGDSTGRDMAFARETRLPVNRHGGNGTSRYNWLADSSNAAAELDNEPGLWMETHRDVHALPLGYHEQIEYTIAYARAIKSADPTAAVLGPTDIQWDDCWKCVADGARDNGSTPLGLWYLQQMAAAEKAYGQRLLDYFSEHYPGQNAASPVARAVENVRLWRKWIAEAYPGTRLSIDEYSWTNDMKSFREGLLVAEGLGAFGREGVDLASYWPTPDWNGDATTPAALAFRLYRNYDGAGSAFGETSVRASSSNEARLAVFAAQSADGSLTLVAVNKSAGEVQARVSVSGAPGSGRAAAYRLSEANPRGIARVEDVTYSGGSLSVTLPPSSATLLALAGS